MMRATIRSIAEIAKVSRGTVDRVLHNRPGVSQKVREEVKKIADEMGYKVNWAGRSLAYQKNPVKIGVIILDKNDSSFDEIYKGIKQAYHELKDSGITVECCVMKSVTIDEQLRCIKELENKNIRGLALSPLDEEIIRLELNKISKKNIKIITFNTDILDIEKLCYVGQDLIKSGRVAGQLMGKLLPKNGNVAIITGLSKLKALDERQIGFEEIIKHDYPGIKVVDVVKIFNYKESPYLKTIELFRKHSDLNGIFITGRGIDGVAKAIHEQNKKDIKFVCFDLNPDTIKFINDNTIDFTITQEPLMQGYLPIKIFFNYFFRNKLPSKKYLYTKLEIKTKENI